MGGKNLTIVWPDNKECGWILGRMAEHIAAHAPEGWQVEIANRPTDTRSAINYYHPYRTYRRPSPGIDVVFCTHPEIGHFWQAAEKADHVIVMCERYRREIAERVGAEKVTLIYPGVDEQYRDSRLRVFQPIALGRGERKGLTLWRKLCALPWLECICPNGKYSDAEMVAAYRSCDVVLSTAIMEGGPMLVIEGLAAGKPVVAPRGVGFCDDFGAAVTLYDCNDYDQLLAILRSLHAQKTTRTEAVKSLTWAEYARKHYDLFDRLIEQHERNN